MPKKRTKAILEARRTSALARQAEYDKIPLTERLKTAGKKEAAKIQRRLAVAAK